MNGDATKVREAIGTERPLLSILMVSYNSKQDLPACLNSIQRHVSVPHEIVLVDNGSSDGTLEFVRENYPSVRVIGTGQNLGFAAGNNRAAREARGQYFLLLNCDTILLTDVVAGIRILEGDRRVKIVGARMYDAHGELRANTGHFPVPWRLWKFTLQWSNPRAKPYGDPALAAFRNDWVEGSFLLTTAENWHSVGGMDQTGFMYCEDVQFCAQTAMRGGLAVHCTKLMYIHFGGYTVSRMSLLYAGYRRFHATCSTPAVRRRADAVLLTGLIPRLLVYGILATFTSNTEFKTKFRQFRSVLRNWKQPLIQNGLAPRGTMSLDAKS